MMSVENKVIEILDELSKNAIFRLSLGAQSSLSGSQRNSHTNFWTWLIEQEPKFVSMFGVEFSSIETVDIIRNDEICTVEYKDKNRTSKVTLTADMSFVYDNNLYIVESNLKSLPYENKLEAFINGDIIERYESFERKIISVSFLKPIFDPNLNIYYISYEGISNNLKKIKYLFDDNNENKMILENYIKYLDLINKLYKYLNLNSIIYVELLDKINDSKLRKRIENLNLFLFLKGLS